MYACMYVRVVHLLIEVTHAMVGGTTAKDLSHLLSYLLFLMHVHFTC